MVRKSSQETFTDEDWFVVKVNEDWELPFEAHWLLRLPVIRHIRFYYHFVRMERHYERGVGALGRFRIGYDAWVLYAIHRGWC